MGDQKIMEIYRARGVAVKTVLTNLTSEEIEYEILNEDLINVFKFSLLIVSDILGCATNI